jgi:DUF1680 family protein
MRNPLQVVGLTFLLFQVLGCNGRTQVVGESQQVDTGYPIQSVNIQNVKLTDDFWLPIIKRVQESTIAYGIQKCEEEGRFDNFLIAGGKIEGEARGVMPFDDSDVYKIIEGASNSLISAPNPSLDAILDSLISIVGVGQESDGYLTTWRTINPAKPTAPWVNVDRGVRWESLESSHELYNAGHLYEAAVVHYKATGKRNFLDIALKNADLMVKTFGEKEGQIKAVPGHQIIETGLIQLYRVTGNEQYLKLAKYFLDKRGDRSHHPLIGYAGDGYAQDHIPIVQQKEVVGHAVRAVYMYAAMTDIVAIKKDSLYLNAVNDLWQNMVEKKMYITGGIGARHEGESFGGNYELPNLTAYNETCASIGNVYWNHRMHHLTGEVKYYDIIERTLYNGLISGLSLDGKKFFYPNALESDGVYTFNQGACTRKSWFDCSCCPTNLIRFLPSVPGLIYSKTADEIYVNLYASNTANIALDGFQVSLEQKTQYPLDGKVILAVNPNIEATFTLKLRIPGWARGEVLPSSLYSYINDKENKTTLQINGSETDALVQAGYYVLNRKWKAGDVITLDFPMEIRKVRSNPLVVENKGKAALEYGPLVYAFEEIDNKGKMEGLELTPKDTFDVKMQPEVLGGTNTISNVGFTAIPYYLWSNRGVGKMKVWVNSNE